MARIVIAGLGTSGFAAILAAKKADRKADITVVDDKSFDLMHPCGLPYAVEGIIGAFDKLEHELNLDRMGVTLHHPCRATSVDIKKQIVRADNVETNEKLEIPYDKLLISTGARPFMPPAPGMERLIGRGVFTVSTTEDASALSDVSTPGKHAVCLGAGAIGLETSVALRGKKLEVLVVEMLDSVMPRALDPDMADLVQSHLEELGVRIMCGKRLDEVKGLNELEAVLVDGEEIPADLLVAAAGVRANVELASAAGAETGKAGLKVDERMATSLPNVYAAGDCVETKSIIDGADFTLQLPTIAYRQGTVAGTNMAGGNAIYPGVVGAFVSKVGNLEVAAVGYTEGFAKSRGYKTVFGKIKDSTLYNWYPGGTPLTVKIVADSATGRVIGAQAVGASGAAARVNVASAAIQAGMTLNQMSALELAYCPAVSQAYDPLCKAVDLALRKRIK